MMHSKLISTKTFSGALVLALFVSAPGCKKKAEESAESKPAAPSQEVEAPTASPADAKKAASNEKKSGGAAATQSPANSELELLSAGTGKQQLLRYVYKEGVVKKMTMEQTMAIHTEMVGMPAQQAPEVKLTFEGSMKIAKVSADGTIERESSFSAIKVAPPAGLPPQMAAAMEQQMAPITKLLIKEKANARGQVLEAKVEGIESLPPQLAQTMESVEQSVQQVSIVLPEKPVGVGAKWRSTANIESAGMKLQQISTYEVLSLSGSQLKLKTTVQQSAGKGALEAAGLPPGVTVELKEFKGTAGGEVSVNLSTLDMTADSTAKMAFETISKQPATPAQPPANGGPAAPAPPTEMATKIDMTMTISVKVN